jgi:uncharacterized protein (TIGR02996 family)
VDREDSFLLAIRKKPLDAATRLVYADWLEENGQPVRAELVRVAEAMRTLPVFSDEYWRLKPRRNKLRRRCPADWLAATGYDGSRYDPLLGHVPDDWKGCWRLIREFTERWYGIPMGDVGGRRKEVAKEQRRLGRQLPPSVREFVAYAYDVSPEETPRFVFEDNRYEMEPVDDYPALALLVFLQRDMYWAVHYDDLGRDDPPVHLYELSDDPEGPHLAPWTGRDGEPYSVSEFLLMKVEFHKPEAGNFRSRVAETGKLRKRLNATFPVRKGGGSAWWYEGHGILVYLYPDKDPARGYVLDVSAHPSVTREQVPGFLLECATVKSDRSGIFLLEQDLRK